MAKTNFLITGAQGFIGGHLINALKRHEGVNYFVVDRDFQTCYPYLPDAIDTVFHLASSHREEKPEMVYKHNIEINKRLIGFLNKHHFTCDVVFTSSIHELQDTPYGKSKREGAHYIESVCQKWGRNFTKLTLPNVFGPNAKPNHTSVVANFCYNLIHNKKSYINDVSIKLAYVNTVVHGLIYKDETKITSTQIPLKTLYNIIEDIHEKYENNSNIVVNNKFKAQLLATYISYRND